MSQLEIRIAGTGGQGLILAAKMLALALAADGRRVAQSQTYEPTSRGGFCTSDLVVAETDVDYPLVSALDYLVLLDALAVRPSLPLVKPGTLAIADSRLCPDVPAGAHRLIHLPLSRTGLELGSERVTNMVALGALVAITGICQREVLRQAVSDETPRSFRQLNLAALEAGWSLGEAVGAPGRATQDRAQPTLQPAAPAG
jgi:2-oxoglutarate ferredoxin oxidoreductase subunit gamma